MGRSLLLDFGMKWAVFGGGRRDFTFLLPRPPGNLGRCKSQSRNTNTNTYTYNHTDTNTNTDTYANTYANTNNLLQRCKIDARDESGEP